MRSDAHDRREALIFAATECFAKSGYGVPLDEIARRADVGRGTLYRNFKDRRALVVAIFDREIAQLEAAVDSTTPLETAIKLIARKGAGGAALFARMVGDLKADKETRKELESVGVRLLKLIEPIVAAAHKKKQLRRDVTAEQVVLSLRMIGGLLLYYMSEMEREQRISEALAIVMQGIAIS